MSQENVDAFGRGVEAINRRDVDALLEELDPEVEWRSVFQMMLGGEATVYRGHEGIREMLEDAFETLVEIDAEYSDIRDLGDRILAIGSFRARGRGSGVEIESPLGSVADLRNGKAIRIRTYLDPNEALKAAGLAG